MNEQPKEESQPFTPTHESKSYAVYLTGIGFNKLLTIQTQPTLSIVFKDEEISADELVERLSKPTLTEQQHESLIKKIVSVIFLA